MKAKITPHPEKGLNPHLAVCTRCGKDTGEIVLLGVANRVFTCPGCGMEHWGFRRKPQTCSCGEDRFESREIRETEKAPGICDECAARQKACDEEVKRGGVYFRCKKCGSTGAVKVGTPLASFVRKHAGVEAPKPVGVELDDCPQCRGEGGDGEAGQAEGEPDPGVHAGGVQEGRPQADGCGCGACGRSGREDSSAGHEDGG